MKFLGRIEGREVVVMLDSGASHNFVSRKLVTELGLPVDETVNIRGMLGGWRPGTVLGSLQKPVSGSAAVHG
ncbi:hypothetical protein F511_37430 [Dorcoceras hygrometricum]|uniref:Uncharacterized protein n=1 Tax=Dorcoceras hygrometricum TaxID=472368 RepID=A0A2Z7AHG5_9LAMI|nr:hypothetical protein F511_37430 [Dorcoceras hygrometricum]